MRTSLQMHIARLHPGRPIAFQMVLEDSFSNTPSVGTLAIRLKRARVLATVSPTALAEPRRKAIHRPKTCGALAVHNQVYCSCSFCGAMGTHPPHRESCGLRQHSRLSSCCVLFSKPILVEAMDAKADQRLGVVSACTADRKTQESLMNVIMVQVQPA